MIGTLLGIESTLLVAMARCRKRAAVLRSLAARRLDSPSIRALTRSIAMHTRNTTTMDRVLATKAATLIRSFVQTTAFDQLVLSAVAHIRARGIKRGVR
jgi:hypothetical protein